MKLTKKTLRRPQWRSVWLFLQLPKPILNETRDLEIFNHINYKVIGLVLSEI